jgi:hypothetical protein
MDEAGIKAIVSEVLRQLGLTGGVGPIIHSPQYRSGSLGLFSQIDDAISAAN